MAPACQHSSQHSRDVAACLEEVSRLREASILELKALAEELRQTEESLVASEEDRVVSKAEVEDKVDRLTTQLMVYASSPFQSRAGSSGSAWGLRVEGYDVKEYDRSMSPVGGGAGYEDGDPSNAFPEIPVNVLAAPPRYEQGALEGACLF